MLRPAALGAPSTRRRWAWEQKTGLPGAWPAQPWREGLPLGRDRERTVRLRPRPPGRRGGAGLQQIRGRLVAGPVCTPTPPSAPSGGAGPAPQTRPCGLRPCGGRGRGSPPARHGGPDGALRAPSPNPFGDARVTRSPGPGPPRTACGGAARSRSPRRGVTPHRALLGVKPGGFIPFIPKGREPTWGRTRGRAAGSAGPKGRGREGAHRPGRGSPAPPPGPARPPAHPRRRLPSPLPLPLPALHAHPGVSAPPRRRSARRDHQGRRFPASVRRGRSGMGRLPVPAWAQPPSPPPGPRPPPPLHLPWDHVSSLPRRPGRPLSPF